MLYHYAMMIETGKTMVASTARSAGRHGAWDGVGLAASGLCLVHCLAFPLLIAALPALASVTGEGEAFHVGILAIAIPSSLFALLVGRGRHGAVWPLVAGLLGLLLLTLGVVELLDEVAATVLGSCLLVAAHIANWRYRQQR